MNKSGDITLSAAHATVFILGADSVRRWRQVLPSDDSTSIGSKFINSIAIASDSVVWYGSVGDGFGYDIASVDLDETDLYIEVKTTRGGSLTPFRVMFRP